MGTQTLPESTATELQPEWKAKHLKLFGKQSSNGMHRESTGIICVQAELHGRLPQSVLQKARSDWADEVFERVIRPALDDSPEILKLRHLKAQRVHVQEELAKERDFNGRLPGLIEDAIFDGDVEQVEAVESDRDNSTKHLAHLEHRLEVLDEMIRLATENAKNRVSPLTGKVATAESERLLADYQAAETELLHVAGDVLLKLYRLKQQRDGLRYISAERTIRQLTGNCE